MSKMIRPLGNIHEEDSPDQTTTLQTKIKQYEFTNKHSSLVSTTG